MKPITTVPQSSLSNLQRNNERQIAQAKDKLFRLAMERGYEVLSDYTTRRTEMAFRCDKGHEFRSTPLVFFNSKGGCSQCGGNRIYTIDEIKNIVLQHGVKLLSTRYLNRRSLLRFQCLKDPSHVYERPWAKQLHSHRCQLCLRIDDLGTRNRLIADAGYKLIGSLPQKALEHFTVICPEGHHWKTTWSTIKSKKRCMMCHGSVGYDEEHVRSSMATESYELLSGYQHVQKKLTVKCPKGHTYYPTFERWNRGERCFFCSPSKPLDQDFVRDYFAGYGYLLLGPYKNSGTKMDLQCPGGHHIQMNWEGFRGKHNRCPVCQISYEESLLYDWLREHFTEDQIIRHDRTLLNGKEMDLYVPHKQLAIEYNGNYWHSTKYGRSKYRHHDKLVKCRQLGIRLVTIFEHLMKDHNSAVKSYLNALIANDVTGCIKWLDVLKQIDGNALNNCFPLPVDLPVMFEVLPTEIARCRDNQPVYDCGWSVIDPKAWAETCSINLENG